MPFTKRCYACFAITMNTPHSTVVGQNRTLEWRLPLNPPWKSCCGLLLWHGCCCPPAWRCRCCVCVCVHIFCVCVCTCVCLYVHACLCAVQWIGEMTEICRTHIHTHTQTHTYTRACTLCGRQGAPHKSQLGLALYSLRVHIHSRYMKKLLINFL